MEVYIAYSGSMINFWLSKMLCKNSRFLWIGSNSIMYPSGLNSIQVFFSYKPYTKIYVADSENVITDTWQIPVQGQ